MRKREEEELLAAFRAMAAKDRPMLVKYAQACAKENPPKRDYLRLVVGDARSA